MSNLKREEHQERLERATYGCVFADFMESVESSVAVKIPGAGGYPMVAVSLLSDVQEMIEFGDKEGARQALNRVKRLIIDKWASPNGKPAGMDVSAPEEPPWTLVKESDGSVVAVGAKVTSFRGDRATLVSVQPPHKPGSTGRVYVRFGREETAGYYPGVFGLKFVQQ